MAISLESLPVEIISHIFGFLGNADAAHEYLPALNRYLAPILFEALYSDVRLSFPSREELDASFLHWLTEPRWSRAQYVKHVTIHLEDPFPLPPDTDAVLGQSLVPLSSLHLPNIRSFSLSLEVGSALTPKIARFLKSILPPVPMRDFTCTAFEEAATDVISILLQGTNNLHAFAVADEAKCIRWGKIASVEAPYLRLHFNDVLKDDTIPLPHTLARADFLYLSRPSQPIMQAINADVTDLSLVLNNDQTCADFLAPIARLQNLVRLSITADHDGMPLLEWSALFQSWPSSIERLTLHLPYTTPTSWRNCKPVEGVLHARRQVGALPHLKSCHMRIFWDELPPDEHIRLQEAFAALNIAFDCS